MEDAVQRPFKLWKGIVAIIALVGLTAILAVPAHEKTKPVFVGKFEAEVKIVHLAPKVNFVKSCEIKKSSLRVWKDRVIWNRKEGTVTGTPVALSDDGTRLICMRSDSSLFALMKVPVKGDTAVYIQTDSVGYILSPFKECPKGSEPQ